MESLVKQETQPKPRLIVRLGIFLASHHILFSVICCSAGIIALLLLPSLAKNTYLSENALIPGKLPSNLFSFNCDPMNAYLLLLPLVPLFYALLFLVLLVGFIYRLPQLAWN